MRFRPYGTQRYVIEAILRAVAAGKREILILKARQIGITTALLIFDLYWHLKFRGMQGALVSESDKTTEYLRGTLAQIAASLRPPFFVPMVATNRYNIRWAHQSRLVYATAGLRKNTGLGKGRGLTYLHAEEVSEWGDPEGFDSLRATVSQKHPYALSLYASTAQGFNFFHSLWQDFARAVTLEALFVGWWRHEAYTVLPGSAEYDTYWDGLLDPDERAWQEQIDRRWGVTLTPAQWAWYRWYRSEKSRGDQRTMHQNYPTLPEHAFQSSGGGFVDDATFYRLRERLADAPEPAHYRYLFGGTFEASELVDTDPAMAELTVWEPPREGAHYVVAADPAFGANQNSDTACIQVWRATRDGLVQAAEFGARDMPVHQFAWVIFHLAGSYWRHPGRSHLILEINGPGRAVWQEMQRLVNYGQGTTQHADLQNVLGNIQHYIYRKPDSMNAGGAWQWLTTHATRKLLMEKLRDALLSTTLTIRSGELIEECANLRREGDEVKAAGATHDDRAVTCALAIECWQEQALPLLLMMPPDADTPIPAPEPGHQRVVRSFFDRIMA